MRGGYQSGQAAQFPACPPSHLAEMPVLAAEIELQQVYDGSISLESVFKAWLHEQGGRREHLQLLLPPALPGSASHPGIFSLLFEATSPRPPFTRASFYTAVSSARQTHISHQCLSIFSLLHGSVWSGLGLSGIKLVCTLPPAVCLKCDMQERLLSPALLPGILDLGAKTESIRDFSLPVKDPASHSVFPHQLTVIK